MAFDNAICWLPLMSGKSLLVVLIVIFSLPISRNCFKHQLNVSNVTFLMFTGSLRQQRAHSSTLSKLCSQTSNGSCFSFFSHFFPLQLHSTFSTEMMKERIFRCVSSTIAIILYVQHPPDSLSIYIFQVCNIQVIDNAAWGYQKLYLGPASCLWEYVQCAFLTGLAHDFWSEQYMDISWL